MFLFCFLYFYLFRKNSWVNILYIKFLFFLLLFSRLCFLRFSDHRTFQSTSVTQVYRSYGRLVKMLLKTNCPNNIALKFLQLLMFVLLRTISLYKTFYSCWAEQFNPFPNIRLSESEIVIHFLNLFYLFPINAEAGPISYRTRFLFLHFCSLGEVHSLMWCLTETKFIISRNKKKFEVSSS